jgi:5-methylthioadenosine/S-adenosylhomocysteine deaminase
VNFLSNSDIDIAIINGQIVTMNKELTIYQNGYLFVKNSRIVAIGSMKKDDFPGINKIDVKEIIDANGGIVFPGFVNTHGHFSMTLFRGIADDIPLKKWLTDYIWPIEGALTEEDCYIGAQLAAIEMIQGGTTTACDMYFFEEEIFKALEEIGFRGVLGHGMLDFGNDEKRKQELEKTEELIKIVKNKGNICSVIVSPHAPDTCSEELLLQSKKMAEKYDLPLQIHLAETQDEVKKLMNEKKWTPTKFLDEINFLNERLIAAHCVWLTKDDIHLLQENNVKIAHNPSSNLKLGSGVMDYKNISKYDIIISIGTDGAASNNNLSMLEELRLASYLHKGINANPTILPAKEILKMGTINGAQALGIAEETGSLELNKKADIIIVDIKKPNTWPPHDPYSLLVYSANSENVSTVIINGKVVMKEKKLLTIDVNDVLKKAKKATLQLMKKTNLNQYNLKQRYLE